MRRIVPSSVVGLQVLATAAGLVFLQEPLHYPWVVSEIDVKLPNAQAVANAKPTARLDVGFLGHGLETVQACQLQVAARLMPSNPSVLHAPFVRPNVCIRRTRSKEAT